MTPAAIAAPDARDLSADDFAAVARMAHAHAGIVLHPGKRILVSSRLAKLVRAHGCRDIAEYIQHISHDPKARTAAIEALTTNHTRFFREDHHFRHFDEILRPEIIAALDKGRRVRMWSAGSSSGEEVYSLAMTLLGSNEREGRRILSRDIAMLATDLNGQVLDAGRAGRYAAEATDAISEPLGRLWTERSADALTIRREVRDIVRFRQLNLLGEWPIAGQFQAIFCRNTMIYFDAATNERLQCRLAEKLLPGGYLYIGHSERLLGAAAGKLRPVGQTVFRRPVS
ncbi:CheR family methyltransferase [Sphingomonas baiyangensis]|uniref:CheR family methyltransferase n=1 Tax=Sphingomonas baiyangensis TaxID=2572576 RepID=UPI0010AE4EC9|nr:protein-glutamate O-methyltransferase CheR [Sphingomonas baiyangensis]